MLFLYLSMLDTPEDKQKMTELYITYREYLLKIALEILHNQDDAEDVLHQAFLRLTNDLTKVEDVSSHQTRNFLVIIIRGLAINLYNKHKRTIDFEDMNAMSALTANDPILDQVSHEGLHEALGQLPAPHREVLYLMYFQDLPVRKIAELLRLGESAVKKRLERARWALQKILIEEGLYVA